MTQVVQSIWSRHLSTGRTIADLAGFQKRYLTLLTGEASAESVADWVLDLEFGQSGKLQLGVQAYGKSAGVTTAKVRSALRAHLTGQSTDLGLFDPARPLLPHQKAAYIGGQASMARNFAVYLDGLSDPDVWGFRYITMRDERVRASHAVLYGAAYEKTHPFWITYCPPNGWNCRCWIEPIFNGSKLAKEVDVRKTKTFKATKGDIVDAPFDVDPNSILRKGDKVVVPPREKLVYEDRKLKSAGKVLKVPTAKIKKLRPPKPVVEKRPKPVVEKKPKPVKVPKSERVQEYKQFGVRTKTVGQVTRTRAGIAAKILGAGKGDTIEVTGDTNAEVVVIGGGGRETLAKIDHHTRQVELRSDVSAEELKQIRLNAVRVGYTVKAQSRADKYLGVDNYNASNGLTGAERAAIDHYTKDGYLDINRYLRHGTAKPLKEDPALVAEIAEKTVAAAKKLPRYEGVVYRGEYGNYSADAKPGGLIVDKALMSTFKTIDGSMKGAYTQLVITQRSGRDVVRGGFPHNENEQEVLLLPNTQLRVDRVDAEDSNGRTTLYLTETAPPRKRRVRKEIKRKRGKK